MANVYEKPVFCIICCCMLSQAYEAMPIEDFGLAMLRGMGWKEGMGVGRNRKV